VSFGVFAISRKLLGQPEGVTTQADRSARPRPSSEEDGSEPSTRVQYMEAVTRLRERLRRTRRRYNTVMGLAAVGVALALLSGHAAGRGLNEGYFADNHQLLAFVLAGVAFFALALRHEGSESIKRRIVIAQHVVDVLEEEQEREDVAEETVDLDSLLKTNRNLLRQYHSISTEQAQEAF